MTNGKAYVIVCCPVNTGVDLHLLADCFSFYADYLDHIFAQTVPECALSQERLSKSNTLMPAAFLMASSLWE